MNLSVPSVGWGATAGPAEATMLCSRVMCYSRPAVGEGQSQWQFATSLQMWEVGLWTQQQRWGADLP